jgi:hypothetical protein
MNKLKAGYQIPVRRIYRLDSEKDTESAASARSLKSTKLIIKQPPKEIMVNPAPTAQAKIPLRKPLAKR